jgi:signal peptidase I
MGKHNQEIPQEPNIKHIIKEWIQSILIAFIVAMFIRTFFIQPYRIPSGSMIPTLKIGDHPLVNKLVYKMREPQRGDVIVFLYPVIEYGCTECMYKYKVLGLFNRYEYRFTYEYREDYDKARYGNIPFEQLPDNWTCPICGTPKSSFKKAPRKPFIKRLIGLPGETIKIAAGKIYINGKALEEPSNITQRHYIAEKNFAVEETKIPLDSYFVLGDNVTNSKDSRYWGFVPKENIIGKATFVYWPLHRIRRIR